MWRKQKALILKEIQYTRYFYVAAALIIFGIVLLVGFMNGNAVSIGAMYYYSETALAICLSLMCSEIIYGQGDLNIILSAIRSKFQYILTKYLIYFVLMIITFFAVSILQYLLQTMLTDQTGREVFESELHIWMDLVPTFLFSSTLAVFVSLLLRSRLIAYGVSFILPLGQINTAIGFYQNDITDYRWLFTSFHTTYLENTRMWDTNKVFYLLLSVVLWIMMFYILKYTKKDLVGKEEQQE